MVSNINDFRNRELLTADLLRARLRGTVLHSDPVDVVAPPGSERWPRALKERLGGMLTPAGVLIPVMQRTSTLSLLLTKRSAELKSHAGQVSFPGGRMEEHDPDVAATALRETHEEVGIEPRQVAVIGYLEPMPTITGYAVTPVIGLVQGSAELVIDHTEVEYAFEVPLEFLLDEANDQRVERDFHGRTIPMVEFHYDGQRIWGATAQMVLLLRKYLK
ncbi:MAG: CoA pyrophosphatase [Gammaproteobacteria bacterium]|nr:CoA pyrophosphatase [Gammaproteobacteria bacterium]MBU2675765.1 CoA pyrophosphatase [Gammaproteobacteria bacterium]NNL49503.1 CoA pyrophosphatase [Woeseiaceae bacterium]